jgi:two-component system cell cycle sensor histidine kinase/response regulator CckA
MSSGPSEKFPPEQPLRLLIADDDSADVDLCLYNLKKAAVNFQAEIVQTREQFLSKLGEQPVDIVLSDYRMKNWTGLDALSIIQENCPEVPVILLSGTLGDELAVECIKKGITDYVLKDQLARLPMALRRAQEEKALRQAEVRAAQALRESEERYRTLVEYAPEAIVVFDADTGAFLDCNTLALRLFGLSRDELLRTRIKDVSVQSQPESLFADAFDPGTLSLASSKATAIFEWLFRNSLGVEIPCEVHLIPLPSPTHRLIRGSILDITERKQTERALRHSEARFRSLVDNATYGFYWVTTTGRLLYANPALVRILGYDSAEELLALQTTEDLFCDPAARKKVYEDYFESGRASATVQWKRKDSKIITVRISGRQAHDPDRGRECIEVIVEDITERIILEKQLSQAQKFEAFGQLAGGIAHDFNNMIGAIIGWADLGCDETEKGTRIRRHFEKVRQQADRAASLTRQLLAFARRQILEPRNIDLNQAVIETVSLLENVIGSNIEIRVNLDRDLAVVRADPTQIEQVLMNLCINARDAMSNGGSIEIESVNVVLDEAFCGRQPLARPGEYVCLSVSDTGSGMDQATLDRIFEPFFTTKEMGKGTGLGLATVYGILSQHGGFIHVQSELGRGTTFRVYLPVSTVTQTPAAINHDLPVRGGSEVVLVAEDHEGLRHLADETLTNLGYEVVLAADGEDAVRKFQNNLERIQLALLDVVLPKMNGPDVYAKISALKADVAVIFATGYSPDIAQLQKVMAQGLPILQKPYSPRDLARKVRETLDRRVISASQNL